MKTINNDVLDVLKQTKTKDLVNVERVLRRAIKHGVSIEEAAAYEQFEPDMRVKYLGRNGEHRYGNVLKVNQRLIRIEDAETKELAHVLPQDVEPHRGRIPKKLS